MRAVALQSMAQTAVAIRLALADRRACLWGGLVFVVTLVAYLFILPATNTGGVIGLVSLHFLDVGEFVLALIMATLLGLTTALGVFGLQQGARTGSSRTAVGAIIALLPSLLCCSPVLPLTITALASVLPAAGRLGLPIQGFIATHEAWLYAIAVALMVWGLYTNARRVLFCTI